MNSLTILIQKRGYISRGYHQAIIKFLKEFTNYRKKINKLVVLAIDLSPAFLNREPHMRPFNNLEYKIHSDT